MIWGSSLGVRRVAVLDDEVLSALLVVMLSPV
jgi:hypothetical protein